LRSPRQVANACHDWSESSEAADLRSARKAAAEARDRLRASEAPSAFTALDAKPSTVTSYRRLANLHIIPTLGEREVQRLTPNDLRALYRQLGEKLAPLRSGWSTR
jgi:hypothetical protein